MADTTPLEQALLDIGDRVNFTAYRRPAADEDKRWCVELRCHNQKQNRRISTGFGGTVSAALRDALKGADQ